MSKKIDKYKILIVSKPQGLKKLEVIGYGNVLNKLGKLLSQNKRTDEIKELKIIPNIINR